MNLLPAKIIDYGKLPENVREFILNTFKNDDRYVPNNSYHPFPSDLVSIKDALEEAVYPYEDERYRASPEFIEILNWFKDNITQDYIIIHFNW